MADVLNAELGVQRTPAQGRRPIMHIKTIALVVLLCLASVGVWDMSSAKLLRATHAAWRQLHEAPETHHDGHPTHHPSEHETGDGHHEGGHHEGGHHEGDHHEGAHHKGGHHDGGHPKNHEFSHVDTTSAIMLFGLFLFNNLVLYFVNYRDEHIRDNSYKMINTTISIFAAVMLNSSVFAFICEQIIPSPFPRGFNIHQVKHGDPEENPELIHAMYAVVGVFVLFFNFAVINQACLYFRHNHHALFGIESITGHLCAFSAIYCFGNLMELRWFSQSAWRAFLVVLIEVLVCTPIIFLTKRWRNAKQLMPHEPHEETNVQDIQKKKDEHKKVMIKASKTQNYEAAQHCKDKIKRLDRTLRTLEYEKDYKGQNSKFFDKKYSEMTEKHREFARQNDYEEAKFHKDMANRFKTLKEAEERKEKKLPMPKDHWMHAAEEAEDEAVTLVSSFLISQVVGFLVIGHLPAMHHDHMSEADLHRGTNISWCAIGASVLLVIGTILLRTQWDKSQKEKARKIEEDIIENRVTSQKPTPSWLLRLVPGIHRLVGMCVSWFLYRSLEWHMRIWVPEELHVAHSLAAFVALVAALVAIWILDYFGDKLRDSHNKQEPDEEKDVAQQLADLEEEPESRTRPRTPAERLSTGDAQALLDGVVEGGLDMSAQIVGTVVGDKDSHAHVEDAFRNLIRSVAVFVGLSWEKAFDVAEATVVAKLEFLEFHPVISKVILALLVCSFMLPGWYWYVMPKALMDPNNHKERLLLEKEQEMRNKEGDRHVR